MSWTQCQTTKANTSLVSILFTYTASAVSHCVVCIKFWNPDDPKAIHEQESRGCGMDADSLPCQSTWHEPVTSISEIMYAEEGWLSQSVLYHAMRHEEHQIEGRRSVSWKGLVFALPSLFGSCHAKWKTKLMGGKLEWWSWRENRRQKWLAWRISRLN